MNNNNRKCTWCHQPINQEDYRDEKLVEERAKKLGYCQACIDKLFSTSAPKIDSD